MCERGKGDTGGKGVEGDTVEAPQLLISENEDRGWILFEVKRTVFFFLSSKTFGVTVNQYAIFVFSI